MARKTELKFQSSQVIYDAARKKGVKVEVISRKFNLMKLTYRGKSLFVKGNAYPVNPQSACFIADNKYLTKKVLRLHDIAVPKSWLVRTPKEAKDTIIAKNLFPCVLKPIQGSHGTRVFANLESLEELEAILPYVFNQPGEIDVLVEEFIKGTDYRLLVVGDKVSAVMERIPAHVIGDGAHNIRQLVSIFNRNPLVGKKYEKPLCKIKLNGEAKRNLKKQRKKLTYIPHPDEKIYLRQNSNISTGGIGKDVTDKISSKLKKVAIEATKALGMVIAGVDIIYDEVAQKPYVLELNGLSGIDVHHFPVLGKPRDVAGDIVDLLLKK